MSDWKCHWAVITHAWADREFARFMRQSGRIYVCRAFVRDKFKVRLPNGMSGNLEDLVVRRKR